MIKHFNSNKARQKRHMRARNRVQGTQLRPRLNVFRSGTQIYAQVIDDKTGRTLAAASSLDETLKDFKPAPPVVATTAVEEQMEVVEVVTEAAPAKKAPKAPVKAPAKSQSQKSGGRVAQAKTVLPAAKKGERKTPVEALAAIAGNHKVALAREVGKLVAQRAKEQGVEQVVFDRGGYAYHGRVAALAEGAREIGLKF